MGTATMQGALWSEVVAAAAVDALRPFLAPEGSVRVDKVMRAMIACA
jgi:hypothetical protein